jgi:hypothetical protein
MERDHEDRARWFDLTKSQWIQGLVARYEGECRVYVVTIEPEMADAQFQRWPRIMWGHWSKFEDRQ